MIRKKVCIVNKLGLHARAASQFVKLASKYQADINVCYNNKEVNGKSILGMMILAASKGVAIEIIVSGKDEREAIKQLTELVNNKFGEDE